jgi:hypothetical protein
LPWSHHRLSSCLSTGLNQWTFTVSTSAFFNKIGTERTLESRQQWSACKQKADMTLRG